MDKSAECAERLAPLRSTNGLRLVDIADAERSISAASSLRLRLLCRLLPSRLLAPRLLDGDLHDVDRTAAIVFSSPPQTDGDLRGVVLSHHNILSNMESLKQVFRVSREDRILGVLSFASPFGLMGTLLLPQLKC